MGKTIIKSAAMLIWSVLVIFSVHSGAIRSELRYTRIAEGNISQSVHAIWLRGWSGYMNWLKNDARLQGRVRPLHVPFHSISFVLTSIRNGDLFRHDSEVRLSERINGDLQTHSFFLLCCFSVSLAALASAMRRVTGAWWPGLLLPLLCVPGNYYLSQNLLVNFCDSGEIGQLLFISMYIGLVAPMFTGDVPGWRREAAASFFLLLAYSMKETTVVVMPVMLVLLGLLGLRSSVKYRSFAVRHAVLHIILSAVLLSAVYAFKSGAYVSQNYMASNLGDNLLWSWGVMTAYSDTVPYVVVGAIFLAAMLLRGRNREKDCFAGILPSIFILLLAAGICSGFWVINLPWGQSMSKYYLPVYIFASMAGVMILHVSSGILWRHQFRAAAGLWLAGSLVFLFQHVGGRLASTKDYYIENYGYRQTVTCIVKDIAQYASLAENTCSAHIVADSMYQEGVLPFLRQLNRFHKFNIAQGGKIVSSIRSCERNYFRRYPGRPAAEVTLSEKIPERTCADSVYLIGDVVPGDVERLESMGYSLLAERSVGSPGVRVARYARRKS